MNRRKFLTTSSSAGLLATLSPALRAMAPRPGAPVGLQLFTVMVQLEQDFEGTLATISGIGYREVETIGAMGHDPAALKKLFDRYGLSTPSQHLMAGNLYESFNQFARREITAEDVAAAWAETMSISNTRPVIEEAIERAKILGQQYIVLQIIWPEQMASRAALEEFCGSLNLAGELCAKAGLTFNFHNHAKEMQPQDGYVPYQVILESTDPETVKLELDVYWATVAGADPVEYLQRYAGRYVQCHLKDATADGDFATVGQGVIDFPAVLKAARQSGVRHCYVEYDRAEDPIAVIRDAYAYLAPLI